MKQLIKQFGTYKLVVIGIVLFFVSSCQKDLNTGKQIDELESKADKTHWHLHQTNTYSSDVAVKWMDMQIRLMRTATGIPNVAFTRPYAYSAIALYEAVVPGMPDARSLAGQLSGLYNLPRIVHGLAYHWPSVANAALASINKNMFPTTSDVNKASIDSLENALNTQYLNESGAEIFNRSKDFGKAVAQKVFDWAQTDGYLHANDYYPPPTGPGFWVPPTLPIPVSSTPYWGDLRLMITGSGDNAQPGAPTLYSEDPSSDFYKMAKQVYDVSLPNTITTEQTAMALYWRDIPGVTTPGHYVSILKQVLENDNPKLDKAAIAYALSGIIVFDAAVSVWKTKYTYNLVRPITYIRNVLGHTTWSPLLTTPAHPEYSSAHAALSAAVADAFSNLFGSNYSFTDHTYDYLGAGFEPRPFSSFRAFGIDAGNSRLYAGIHYQPSIDAGLKQGRRIAQNIIRRLKFLDE